jgi:hypothetical protein
MLGSLPTLKTSKQWHSYFQISPYDWLLLMPLLVVRGFTYSTVQMIVLDTSGKKGFSLIKGTGHYFCFASYNYSHE